MKVIITFTFCCDNLRKSKLMILEKPGKLRDFFLLLCGHPALDEPKKALQSCILSQLDSATS